MDSFMAIFHAIGSHKLKPTSREIVRELAKEGFRPSMLEIYYDPSKELWRWQCAIFDL